MRSLLKIALLTVLVGVFGIVNANPPAASGIVTRSNEPVALFFADTDAGMSTILGGDIVELMPDGSHRIRRNYVFCQDPPRRPPLQHRWPRRRDDVRLAVHGVRLQPVPYRAASGHGDCNAGRA